MTPEKSGFYWARPSKSYGWYSLMVKVSGEPPMLYIDHALDLGLNGPRVIKATPGDVVWGPEIDWPEVPKSEIEK